MLTGIALIIGLILLIKGDFRVAGRYIPKNIGRFIGLLLMAPLVIGCSLALMVIPADLEVNSNASVEDVYSQLLSNPEYMRVAGVELISLVIAVIVSLYLIFSRPQTPPNPQPPPQSQPWGTLSIPPSAMYPVTPPVAAAPPPAIMTIEEAAAYLRVDAAEINRLIDEGKLPAARTASGYRIARIAIDDYLKNPS